MADNRSGVLRTDLAQKSGVSDGEGLTKALLELEQCGFIRKYDNYAKSKTSSFYQVIDPFVLFRLYFSGEAKIRSWQSFIKSPAYYTWRGNAFEIVCLNHIGQVKDALGISGVESSEYSWRSKKKKSGAQIDLLIDRRDDIINVCEMKFSDNEFVIDEKYTAELNHKVELFREETKTKKAIHLVLVTANGLKKNEYSEGIQRVINKDALFK